MALSLLRLAVYELCILKEIEPAIAINEAVEIAKLYSTQEDANYINGVLGAVVREGRITMGLYLGMRHSNYSTSAALYNSNTGETISIVSFCRYRKEGSAFGNQTRFFSM